MSRVTPQEISQIPSLDVDQVPLDRFRQTSGIPNPNGMIGPDVTSTGTPPRDDINQSYYISNWNNFKLSFDKAAASGLPAVLYKSARNFFDQHLFDSPVANEQQIEEAKKARPGFVIPEGTTEALLNQMKDNYDVNAVRENILKHSKPTFGGGISGFLGSALGSTIADPISTGTAVAAGALTKNFDVPEMLGLERGALKVAFGRFLQGSAEGAAFGASQALSDKIDEVARGDDLTPINAMSQIGDNMFLGGLLHPVGGALADLWKGNRAFLNEGANDASSTAALMAAKGKDPQPIISLRNTYNQAAKKLRKRLNDANISEADVVAELDNRQNELSKEPESEAKDLEMKSIQVHRAMIQNQEEEIPKDVMDNFIEVNRQSKSDFANGRGQKEMDIVGPTPKNVDDLIQRNFPEDEKQLLLQEVPLDSEDEKQLDEINKSSDLQNNFSNALKSTIQCILGEQ